MPAVKFTDAVSDQRRFAGGRATEIAKTVLFVVDSDS
jgi:hypothetical protein